MNKTIGMRRVFYSLLLGALLLNLAVGARIYSKSAEEAQKDDPHRNLDLFVNVLEHIRQDYVDGDQLTYEDLVHGALKGMLGMLDPHSEFMAPQKYTDLRDDTEGRFGGVGIHINIQDGYLTVLAPMEGTPAFKAGIMSGDQIHRIEGKNARHTSLPEVVNKLRGRPGTEVNVTLFRPSTGESREVTLKRALIKVSTVKDVNNKTAFPLDDDKIGYIRLTQFNEPTVVDLERALKKLEAQGMKGLVLDLRNNPGGLLDQAAMVCEKFLPKGQLVVTTEGRSSREQKEFRASGRNARPDLPLVILVNRFSASASEIVAGCMQDTKRAVIVGENTFGKGSVQKILPLRDGAALRLTTAKYYTPGHKVIHGNGIHPDEKIPMTREEEELLFLKRTPGGLKMIPEDKREKAEKAIDKQFERAMELVKTSGKLQAKLDGSGEDPVEEDEAGDSADREASEEKEPAKPDVDEKESTEPEKEKK